MTLQNTAVIATAIARIKAPFFFLAMTDNVYEAHNSRETAGCLGIKQI